jgi:hypothetical protein
MIESPRAVGMDSQGSSIFQTIEEEGLRKLDALVKGWKKRSQDRGSRNEEKNLDQGPV